MKNSLKFLLKLSDRVISGQFQFRETSPISNCGREAPKSDEVHCRQNVSGNRHSIRIRQMALGRIFRRRTYAPICLAYAIFQMTMAHKTGF